MRKKTRIEIHAWIDVQTMEIKGRPPFIKQRCCLCTLERVVRTPATETLAKLLEVTE